LPSNVAKQTGEVNVAEQPVWQSFAQLRCTIVAVSSRATIRDVAALAGVHPATVSRALDPRRSGRISAATAERVEAAARQLGYAPDPIARTLRSQRDSTVGVLVPDLRNPVFPPIVAGIEDRLSSGGYTALIANTGNDLERERTQLEVFRRRRCDGYIVATATVDDASVTELVGGPDPVVLVNRRLDGVAAVSVGSDDRQGIRLVLEHLVGLGHRHIAHLTGPENLSVVRVRAEAFRAEAARFGLPAETSIVVHCSALDTPSALDPARELLARHPALSAVVAGNDLIALGCYVAADAAGRSCPADLSVVGYNDMPLVEWWRPALTTVRIAQYEIGREAASLLLARMSSQDPSEAKHVVMPVELVVRASTAPPSTGT
jgi:LacI family transcriptional regulator